MQIVKIAIFQNLTQIDMIKINTLVIYFTALNQNCKQME